MGTSDQSDRIELFCAVVIRSAIVELVSEFEESTGLGVLVKFDLNPIVKKRIDKGERFDVVIINPEMIDDLIVQNKVLPETHVKFGRVDMGVAVRANAKAPACATLIEFKRALLNAKSIAYSVDGTSGKTFEGVLRRLGIFETVSSQLKPVAGGETAICVSNGEAELGVIPVSTILEAPGITLAGSFPLELQTRISLSGAICAEARNLSRARALLDFLTAPQADAVLSARGIGRFGA